MHVWLVCCIHCVSKKGDTKLLVITLSNLNRFFKIFWLADFLTEFCNKIVIKDPTTPSYIKYCYATFWKYLVPEIVIFKKWVKETGMKDSNCYVRFNHLKMVMKKVWFGVRLPAVPLLGTNLGQVVYTYMPLPSSCMIWYRSMGGDTTDSSSLST